MSFQLSGFFAMSKRGRTLCALSCRDYRSVEKCVYALGAFPQECILHHKSASTEREYLTAFKTAPDFA